MDTSALHSKLPKYVRVAEELRSQLSSDAWGPGDKLPRVSELKNQFGVSVNTLDKVLGLLEDEGTITRAQGSGIFVARPVQRKRQGAIGFFGLISSSPQVQDPYWAPLVQGALEGARREGLEIMLLSAEWENVRWEKLDGVLLAGFEAKSLEGFAPPALPVVTLMGNCVGTDAVTADDYQGSRLLTEHLIELGHRRIAFLHSHIGYSLQARLAGFRDALRAAGLEANPHWERRLIYPLPEGRFFLAGLQGMNEWFENGWQSSGCTALLCQNDESALGALDAFRQAKVCVPLDVSVAGFDGTSLAELSDPRLTTIDVPLFEIGACGVELVLRRMSGVAAGTRVLPVALQIGASTAPPRK